MKRGRGWPNVNCNSLIVKFFSMILSLVELCENVCYASLLLLVVQFFLPIRMLKNEHSVNLPRKRLNMIVPRPLFHYSVQLCVPWMLTY